MITPVLRVRDVERSLRFYTHLLGFTGEGGLPGTDGKVAAAEAYLGDARVLFARRASLSTLTVCRSELYITLNDGIDELYRRLRTHDVHLCTEMHEELWGERAFTITDPDGNRVTFAQAIQYAEVPVALAQIA